MRIRDCLEETHHLRVRQVYAAKIHEKNKQALLCLAERAASLFRRFKEDCVDWAWMDAVVAWEVHVTPAWRLL